MKKFAKLIFLLAIICSSCQENKSIEVASHFPSIQFEETNPYSPEKAELGKKLFFDPTLSLDSTISCSSCHFEHLAFTDGKSLSTGVEGRKGKRNAPTLLNTAFLNRLNWDGGTTTLETQMLVPIGDHSEMNSSIPIIMDRLNNNSEYIQEFESVWNEKPSPFNFTRSLGMYLRTLISDNSRYDQFTQGDYIFSKNEKRGHDLFFSDSLNCSSCHTPPLFTNQQFLNNGLDTLSLDSGKARVTFKHEDLGLFKVPTLRNIEITGPYMHDGRISSLEEVLDHYENNVQAHFNKSELIHSFHLSKEDRNCLIEFLSCLTDEKYRKD